MALVEEQAVGRPIVEVKARAPKQRGIDPRLIQIGSLSILLAITQFMHSFQASPAQIAAGMAGALLTQWLGDRYLARRPFDPRSALISALSLGLLLRASDPWIFLLGGIVAIGSKFVLRFRGGHIFNPTNFAIVALLLALPAESWISPSQWGREMWLAALAGLLAVAVLSQARRGDIAIAFVLAYGGLLAARALWLGDPLVIAWHHLTSGAVLIFAFFMITDPKTSPASRTGRIVFAVLVAWLAIWLQFNCYLREGLLYALVLCCPLVPLVDRLLPARPRGAERNGPQDPLAVEPRP